MMISAVLVALALQAPSATPQQAIGFDYLKADLTAYAVTRFEVQWDAGAWTTVGLPTAELTVGEGNTYAVAFPALTPNVDHTVSVRACNTGGCSAPLGPLSFRLVVVPPAAGNLRILTRGGQ